MNWTRKKLSGWNEVEYSDTSGRFVIRRRMVASSRNGCWKPVWRLWDTSKNALDGRPSFDNLEALADAKAIAGDSGHGLEDT